MSPSVLSLEQMLTWAPAMDDPATLPSPICATPKRENAVKKMRLKHVQDCEI